jgi:outer membrane scaffolding protein for murein synthesis (MipA/OmpV family)
VRVRHCEIIMLLIGITAGSANAQGVPQAPAWKGTFGMLGMLTPRYEGSDEQRFVALPFMVLSFRDRFYFGPSSTGIGGAVGAHLFRSERATVSIESGITEGRPAERSAALAGMDDRDAIASVSSTMTYALGAFDGVATLSHGLNGDAGALARVELGMRNLIGRVAIRTSIAASWADASEMRRAFGISDEEASRRQSLIDAGDSRLREYEGSAYRPDGGLERIGASVFAAYPLSKRWSLLGLASANRLGNAATHSPFVRQRSQFTFALGVGREMHWGTRD